MPLHSVVRRDNRNCRRLLTPSFAKIFLQVPLDRPRTDVERGADLRVREPVRDEPGDVRLLGRQLLGRLDRPLAHRLPGGQQLPAGAIGERVGAHRRQRLVGGPQLRPGVGASTFPPQPFAVEQLRAGELDADPGATEPLDRLTVQRLRSGVVAQQCTPARLDPERPVRAAGARHLRELFQGGLRRTGLGAAHPGLHQLGERPLGRPEFARIGGCLLRRHDGVAVPAEAVAQHGTRPLRHVHADAFTSGDDVLEAGLDQRLGLLLVTP